MTVVDAAHQGAVSCFEAYALVALYLSRLPARKLSSDQLRQRMLWRDVLNQLEVQGALLPAVQTLSISKAQREALGNAGHRVSQTALQTLLQQLHDSFGLLEGDLLQVVDLGAMELVDLYAVIDKCAERFDSTQVESMQKMVKDAVAEAEAAAEVPAAEEEPPANGLAAGAEAEQEELPGEEVDEVIGGAVAAPH